MAPKDVAQAFSRHQFPAAYPYLDPDVTWTVRGGQVLRGQAAVREACDAMAAGLSTVVTDYDRFLVIDGGDTVAVDAIARYRAADGETGAVASCDVYEFRFGLVVAITSYLAEL